MTDAARFRTETLEWIQEKLLPPGTYADESTELFASGLIDSIRILKLLAWTESRIGRRIADDEIRMDNFVSVRRMAEVFVPEVHHVGP
ncbi:MAG TPA: hypothetical protein VK929_01905 [Longimicrobiales bacterium]|nr:hypothetical protein [Longimicrobiales bacterium]